METSLHTGHRAVFSCMVGIVWCDIAGTVAHLPRSKQPTTRIASFTPQELHTAEMQPACKVAHPDRQAGPTLRPTTKCERFFCPLPCLQYIKKTKKKFFFFLKTKITTGQTSKNTKNPLQCSPVLFRVTLNTSKSWPCLFL